MFTMVRRFIKTGLGFLGVGLLLGAYLLIRRELEGVFPNRYLVSAHVHAVGVGFVMFMILGVALWLFPKPEKEDTRYRPARIEAAYWILVTATAARVVSELVRGSLDATWLRGLVLVAGLGQITYPTWNEAGYLLLLLHRFKEARHCLDARQYAAYVVLIVESKDRSYR